MKRLHFLLLLAFSFCLVSCFDTVEELEIKENGSGIYKMNMDMGKAFEMMKGFMNDSDLQKENLDRPIDTVFNLGTMLDTVQSLSAHKKELLKDGTVHINMDLKKSILKMDMQYPFKNVNNLNELYTLIQKGNGGLNEAFKSTMPATDMPMENNADSSNEINQMNAIYDVVVSNGSYSKTLNKERYDAFLKNEKIDQIKGAMSMMGNMNHTLILKFPKAIKTVSNKLATLSPDNKTVTLKSNFFDVFDNPQLLELKTTY